MITRIDRIQLTAPDRKTAIAAWQRLFGAELVREDRVASLAAARSVLRAGSSEVELLEPRGLGPVAQHASRSRTALFAVGLAVSDLDALRAQLDASAIHHVVDGSQVRLSGEWLGVPGLRVVLSQDEARESAGLLGHVYEVTHLMQGCERAAARLAVVFGLDPAHFRPIRSEQFGYQGVLALFQPDRLDRIETVTPFDRGKTMGRFFHRQGPGFYMAYAEAPDTAAIRTRLLEHAPRDWTGPREGAAPDNLFVHPKALGGLLLGVSRDSFAWSWSGDPARVRAQASA
jgi:hypothetical protein